MLVKCVLCGGEYKLERGSNLSDFQCECGGNLEFKSTTIPVISGNMGTTQKQKIQQKDESKLMYCPDCGKQISKKAKDCPNCGRQFKRDPTSIEIIIYIIAAIIFGAIALFFGLAFLGYMAIGYGNLIKNPIIFYPILLIGSFLILRNAYQKNSWKGLGAYIFWFFIGLGFLGILLGPWD